MTRWGVVAALLAVLLAVPAVASAAAPWGGFGATPPYVRTVSLAWHDGDLSAPRDFQVERSACGAGAWSDLGTLAGAVFATGDFTYDDPGPLADGCYTYRVTPLPPGDLTPDTVDVTVDNTPPVSTTTAPASTVAIGEADVPVQLTANVDDGTGAGIQSVEFWGDDGSGPVLLGTAAYGGTGTEWTYLWSPPAASRATWTIQVHATDVLGNAGAESPGATAVLIDTDPPAAPAAAAQAAVAAGAPALTWPAAALPTDIAGYHVYRGGTRVGTVTGTSFADSLPLDGSADGHYSYVVRAFDGVNESIDSNTVDILLDTVAPGTPTAFTATARSDGTGVDLSWTAPTDSGSGLDTYVVRRAVGPTAPASPTAGTAVCTPAFEGCADTAAAQKTTYTYAVFARDLAGNVSALAQASATTPDTIAPGHVLTLRMRRAGTKIILTWRKPADTDVDHIVVVSRAGAAPTRANDGKVLASARGLVTYARDQAPGTTVFYGVVAVDGAGNESRVASIKAMVPKAGKLTPMDGSELRGVATLRWQKVRDATYYNVQVYRGAKLVSQAWPTGLTLRIAPRKLTAGKRYVWYVWPGFGPRSAAVYGRIIGQASFVWLGR